MRYSIILKRNLFITGKAGTGKTTLLKQYIKELEEANKNILVCASTGIAAQKLSEDGIIATTVHKALYIPVPSFESPSFAKNKKGAIKSTQLKVLGNIDVLIIDEISMLRAEAFTFAMKVLHKAERTANKKIQVIVSGDFSQLPPVVSKNDQTLLKKFGFDKSGYCFTTKEWKDLNFKVIELTEVKRQDNSEFVDNLNQIRQGSTSQKLLNYFNSFVTKTPLLDFIQNKDAILICGTNNKADTINSEYLDSLPGECKALKSKKTGHTTMDISDILLVKEGAKVLFNTNDTIYNTYQNGTFGLIQKITPDYIIVTIDGINKVIKPHEYKQYTYSIKGSTLTQKEVGSILQYPFRIGKAITIHKSQGQTFDYCVISPEIFASGQLYVALSRVKDPQNLYLLSEVKKEHILTEPIVKKFYENHYTYELSKKITNPKQGTKTKKNSTKKTVSKTHTKKKTTTKTPIKKKIIRKTK